MSPRRIRLSSTVLSCLLAVFLIAAGFSRYLETDSGNILIHDIETESWEGFIYGARLFRPLQANSLNLRPSVLLIPGRTADRYTCDHIAMEFARRGFAALTMEDFSRGMTDPEPDYETENLVDAGYTFLSTRSFTDHDRIGLITWFEGADKALEAKYFPDFRTRAFVSPTAAAAERAAEDAQIYTAKYESSAEFQLPASADAAVMIPAVHAGMIADAELIGALLEQFHETLAIPNDSPFWFDAYAQRAQLLTGIRFLLLMLLILISTGISALSTERAGNRTVITAAGIILPLLFFFVINEVMNFFMVSVRIGTPFHYLPRLVQAGKHFSILVFIGFLAVSIIACMPFRRIGRLRFPADCAAAISVILCIAGFLLLATGKISGLRITGPLHPDSFIVSAAFYSCMSSFLLRTVPDRRSSYFCCACVMGTIYYLSSFFL